MLLFVDEAKAHEHLLHHKSKYRFGNRRRIFWQGKAAAQADNVAQTAGACQVEHNRDDPLAVKRSVELHYVL